MPSTATISKSALKWSAVGKFMTAPMLRSASRKGKENGTGEATSNKQVTVSGAIVEDLKASSIKVVPGVDEVKAALEVGRPANGHESSRTSRSTDTLNDISPPKTRPTSPNGAHQSTRRDVAEETDIGLSRLAILNSTGSNLVVPPSNESPHPFELSNNRIDVPIPTNEKAGLGSTIRAMSDTGGTMLGDSRIVELMAENGRLALEIQTLKDELAVTKALEQSSRNEAERNLAHVRSLEEGRSLQLDTIKRLAEDLDNSRRDQDMLEVQVKEGKSLAEDFQARYNGLSEAYEDKKREAGQQAQETQLMQDDLERENGNIKNALDVALLELAKARGECEDKEAQLEAEKTRAQALEEESRRLDESLATNIKDLGDLQEAMMIAANDLEDTRMKLGIAQNERDSSEKRNLISEERVQALMAQLQVGERERAALEELHARQKTTFEGFLVDLESTRKDREAIKISLEEQLERSDSLEKEKRALLEERQLKAQELDDIRRLNKEVKSDLDAVVSDLKGVSGDWEETKDRLQDSEKRNEDSAKQREVLLERLRELQNDFTGKDEELRAALANLERTELDRKETRERLEDQITNLVNERQEGIRELDDLRGTYEKTKGSLEAAVTDLRLAQAEWKETRDQLERGIQRNKELEKESRDAEKRNMRLLEERQIKEKELKDLRESGLKARHALEACLSELERLRQDLNETRGRLESTTRQRLDLEEQNRYLEEACSSKEKDRNLLWEENYKQSQTVEAARLELRGSQRHETEMQAQLNDLEARLEEAEQLNEELEARNRLLVRDAHAVGALPGLVRAFMRPGALW